MTDSTMKWLTFLGCSVVTLFAATLLSTLLAILLTPGRAENLLELLKVLMGWEELLALVLGGIAVGYKKSVSRYVEARAAVLEKKAR